MSEPTPSPPPSPRADTDSRPPEALADLALTLTLNTLGPLLFSPNEGASPAVPLAGAGKPTSPGQRFHVLRPHARGGLGEVFVAYDEELHREVALKEIPQEHASHAEIRSRFVLEAEITGSLEHPGVVPVYGMGRHGDGRPFYAMRFIKGRSLRAAIDSFHQAELSHREPGERTLTLRELLGRFVDVCNTIAYAHSRGVLHRDLKPANIMLGKYGETLVVDWGLAKVIGHTEKSPATQEAPRDRSNPVMALHSYATRVGATLGTPAFMSPEQAQGLAESAGPASDIYSLGAILYMLLTGRAPITDDSVRAVLDKTVRGDWPPPRQVKKNVPPPLDAICRKAMALRPEDRYGSALALAADVSRWLANEPVSAYREPWTTRWGRWMRRHKTAAAVATATVFVAVLLGSAAAVLLERQRVERQVERERQEARHRRGVEASLSEVSHLQQQARWAEARVALGQAESQLREGGAENLQERIEQARRDLELVAKLDAIRLKRATQVEGQNAYIMAGREYAAAFREAGFEEVGGDAERAVSWVAGSQVKDALVAALDDWAAYAPKPTVVWLLEVARRADPDPRRDRLRDPAAWVSGPALRQLTKDLSVAEVSPHLLVALGSRLRVSGENAEPLLRAAQARHPNDFWTNFELALVLRDAKKPAEALRYYQAALVLRRQANGVHMNLGIALLDMGRLPEALAAFRQTLALDPNYSPLHYNLGKALEAMGRLPEADAEYRKAIAANPKFDWAHNNLGSTLYKMGRKEEALAEFRTALTLNPTNADAHNNLGITLRNAGRIDEAIAAHRRAVALDPKNPVRHDNLGVDLLDAGYIEGAIAAHRQAIALDPKRGISHSNLARALGRKGQSDEALAESRMAVALEPTNVVIRNNLGLKYFMLRQFDDARAQFERAIALDPKNEVAFRFLGHTLLQQGKFVEGRQALRRSLELLPGQNPLRSQHMHWGEEMIALDAKLSAFVKGEARPANPEARLNLALLCRLREHHAASVRFYAEAFAAHPKSADDLEAGHRYNAACAACQAAVGRGKDAAKLDDKERGRLRKQALDWLRADLAAWTKRAEGGTPADRATVRLNLQSWPKDVDLSGLRDALAVANLSESERVACQKLWREVAELLKKCGG